METVFVINPMAGQGDKLDRLISDIKAAGAKVYVTKSPCDATSFVKAYGPARFIACGGDGTLSEVVNGAIGVSGAQVGVMPLGTGNDFCRNFDVDFRDISAQINGDTVQCDAIKYATEGKCGYCVNMFNIGFDCNVADLTASMKKKPLVFGPFAYFLSILVMLIKKKGANIRIDIDGETIKEGQILLTSIANGCFCGGGVKSNPLASVQDGLINVNIVNDVSRFQFMKLLPYYMKGTFLKLPGIDEIISTIDCKKIAITPLDGKIKLCCDGEIFDAEKTEFEVIHNAFEFVVPKKD